MINFNKEFYDFFIKKDFFTRKRFRNFIANKLTS